MQIFRIHIYTHMYSTSSTHNLVVICWLALLFDHKSRKSVAHKNTQNTHTRCVQVHGLGQRVKTSKLNAHSSLSTDLVHIYIRIYIYNTYTLWIRINSNLNRKCVCERGTRDKILHPKLKPTTTLEQHQQRQQKSEREYICRLWSDCCFCCQLLLNKKG